MRGGEKNQKFFYQHKKTVQINKPVVTQARQRHRAIWTWKTSLYQATQKSVSREDRRLGSFVGWKQDDIPWCICRAQICVAFGVQLKKERTVVAWRLGKQASGWKSASSNAHSSWENLGKRMSGVPLSLKNCSYKCNWGKHVLVLETRQLEDVCACNSQDIKHGIADKGACTPI